MRNSVCVLVYVLLTISCSDGDTVVAADMCDSKQQGFLSCGPLTNKCQPGQFCMDETFGTCANGCLADVNCSCDQKCQLAPGASIGSCTLVSGLTDLERCQDGCAKMLQCGLLTAADSAGCNAKCDNDSESERKTLADCVETWTCGPLPSCLAGACGPRYPCSGTQQCVDHSCGGAPDSGLADCRNKCDLYDFFQCLAPGGLQQCRDSCGQATPAQRDQFLTCQPPPSDRVECEARDCIQFLP